MVGRFFKSPFTGACCALVSALLGGLSWAGVVVPDTPEQRLQWLGIWFVAFVGFALWAFIAQAVRIRGYEQRFTPNAATEYRPTDSSIYVQDGNVDIDGRVFREHMHHVGIVNLSAKTMTRMRVVLDKMEPHIEHFTYLGKAVKIRSENTSDGYFDLPVADGSSPSRYAAFLNELEPVDGGQTGYIIPYVDRQKMTFDRKTRRLTYRLEGGDMTQAIYFRIEIGYDENNNRYWVTIL